LKWRRKTACEKEAATAISVKKFSVEVIGIAS